MTCSDSDTCMNICDELYKNDLRQIDRCYKFSTFKVKKTSLHFEHQVKYEQPVSPDTKETSDSPIVPIPYEYIGFY